MVRLLCGDCLDLMRDIPAGSVDMILCDLPYGVTKNQWDRPLKLDKLWEEYKRIIKENGAICLFADGMFMADLMESNRAWWRYNLVWDKVLPSGFLNANRRPLRRTEEIVVLYQKQPTYHPQKVLGNPNHSNGAANGKRAGISFKNRDYGEYTIVDNSAKHGAWKHPTSLLTFPKSHPAKCLHPTEKPTQLCEWLIKTFTDPGDVVLDNCMGSGSSGVACVNTGRRFIGIEKNPKDFETAKQRICFGEIGDAQLEYLRRRGEVLYGEENS